jgi:hypothetical protein
MKNVLLGHRSGSKCLQTASVTICQSTLSRPFAEGQGGREHLPKALPFLKGLRASCAVR